MPDLITLTCPSCGAKLKVTDQIHLLACRNCGNEHMVVRDTSSIYLAPLAQDVRGIRVGVDKTAAELAVARLAREIAEAESALRSMQATTNDQLMPPGAWENYAGIAVPIVAILAAVFLCSGNTRGVIFMIFLFIFVFFAYLIISERRRSLADTAKKERIGQLQASLILKQDQYQRNRQIVES